MAYPKLTPVIATDSTEPRYLGDRFSDVVSVKDFGAVGDGVADDTDAFEAAAKSRQGNITVPTSLRQKYPFSEVFEVYVPSGVYIIDRLIDVDNKDIVWILAPSAKLVTSLGGGAYKYLNGIVCRDNIKVCNVTPYGIGNSPTGFVVFNGESYGDQIAPISNFDNLQGLADYNSRDSVGATIVTCSSQDVATIENVTYTSDSVILQDPLSSEQKKRLRKGMIIDTLHTTRCTAFLKSWNEDFSVLYVDEWRETGGNAAVTPENTAGIAISRMTKLYGVYSFLVIANEHNTDRFINGDFNCINKKSDANDNYNDVTNKMWGIQSVCDNEGYKGQVGVGSAGKWRYGFLSRDCDIAYEAYKLGNYTAFRAKQYINSQSSLLLCKDFYDNKTFNIQSNGSIEIGSQNELSASASKDIDFHVSTYTNTLGYDVRIRAVKSASETSLVDNGRGDLIFYAKNVCVTADFRPFTDNVSNLGTSDIRWKQVYAATSSISTSDERLKESINIIDERIFKAWGRVNFVSYKFKDAVKEKGTKARTHIGLIAQRIISEFAKEGIDPFEYGLLCFDKWENSEAVVSREEVVDADAVIDNDGQIIVPAKTHFEYKEVSPAKSAGEVYSIRYEEALALECAYQRWRLEQLEERVNQLTNNTNN